MLLRGVGNTQTRILQNDLTQPIMNGNNAKVPYYPYQIPPGTSAVESQRRVVDYVLGGIRADIQLKNLQPRTSITPSVNAVHPILFHPRELKRRGLTTIPTHSPNPVQEDRWFDAKRALGGGRPRTVGVQSSDLRF